MSTTGIAPASPDILYGRRGAVTVRRLVNDYVAETGARFVDVTDATGTLFDFFCECGDLRCRSLVKVTLEAYRASAPGSLVAHD